MIDHVGLRVSDYPSAKKFYGAALAPLGYRLLMEFTPEDDIGYVGAGFGMDQKPDFWIGVGTASGPIHIALSAPTRAQVDAFFAAAINAGATDNGKPGIRAHYHPNYYGAFVLDGDGNNLEVVCHKAP